MQWVMVKLYTINIWLHEVESGFNATAVNLATQNKYGGWRSQSDRSNYKRNNQMYRPHRREMQLGVV